MLDSGPFTLTLEQNLTFAHEVGEQITMGADQGVTWDVGKEFSNVTGTFVQIDDSGTPGIPESLIASKTLRMSGVEQEHFCRQ